MSIKDLAGQHELKQSLSAALSGDRLSHAILITGSAGSGKKNWGSLLSQAILCPESVGLESCQTCRSCHSFSHHSHPDFFLFKPDGRKIKIEQVRSVRSSFFLQGGKKVCLFEQAEAMTAETASSLLKILEEPPPGLYFILLADKTELLFDTIVSRCQRYVLHPLNEEEIVDLLQRKLNTPLEKAVFIARLSGGLPGYALRIAGDVEFDNILNEAQTLAYKLATGRDSALQLISWAASLVEREDFILLLEMVCLIYRDGLVQNLYQRGEALLNPGQSAKWTETVACSALIDAVLMINITLKKCQNTNANRQLLLESMFIMLQRRLLQ